MVQVEPDTEATVVVPAAPEPARDRTAGTDAWLTSVNLLIGLWTGFFAFLVLGWLVPLALALTPFFMLGLPILAVVLWLTRRFARIERGRYRMVLGVDIPEADPGSKDGSLLDRFRATVRSPARWREIGYGVLRFPLSTVEIVLLAGSWLVPLGALTLPIYNWALPGGGANLWLFTVRTWWMTVLVGVLGVVLLLNAPLMVRWLGRADLAITGRLLGPDRLAARVGELERSRAAVVVSAEQERRRIERDLHDGAQQRLVALAMQLGRARARFGTDPDGARALLDEAHNEAKLALAELRDLARGLHPAVLTDRGLDAALSGLAARSPIPVVVEVDPAAGAKAVPVVDAIAYFVVAEALTNVAKHAKANRAAVVVRRLDGLLRVVVTDDGVGGADPALGTGLRGLADRVSGVDGRLHVDSPSGGPTVLTVELPCVS
ncbi:MAG TPA: sensor domain-containing protein [Mycobacteriales bacterium]|nr:sensor domain-containing protein [Mycobacteriales bacterium]